MNIVNPADAIAAVLMAITLGIELADYIMHFE